MKRIRVGVLGATGMVGQRFVQLLQDHPWFELSALAASERSAGKAYGEAVGDRWMVGGQMPAAAAGMKVTACVPESLDCRVVFSALDSTVAGPIEERFAAAGFAVLSNSKNHRMDADVPLLVPEVNAAHADSVKLQRHSEDGRGFIATNPNCSAAGLVLPLRALMDAYGLQKVSVTTMQALSGAGFAGFSLDISDNVIPFICGEEEKLESEPKKMLGLFDGRRFVNADMAVSAQCNRVNVTDGHTEAVSVQLARKADAAGIAECMMKFNPLKGMGLPTAPDPPIIVRDEEDRPQPKKDRDAGKGMAVTVGRIRPCPILGWKFLVLSHNTVRGAAGGAILNAELLVKKGFV